MAGAGGAGRTKAEGAFRTIGELADELGVPPHRLRYWETRFPQLRPLTRAGDRRYYRADDAALVRRIHTLLERDGYTIRGVQQLLADEPVATPPPRSPPLPAARPRTDPLLRIRSLLADALAADER